MADIRASPGDTVFVHAPKRNIGDDRPCYGECVVVAVHPGHICGPCLYVRDEYGETTVLECYTIPLAMAARSKEPTDAQA